jgi:hypothetical protein
MESRTLNLGIAVAQAENVVTRQVAGETLLVPIAGKLVDMEKLYALDDTAAFIWQHLDGKTLLKSIVDLVAETFGADPDQARRDLEEFVQHLLDEGVAVEAADGLS